MLVTTNHELLALDRDRSRPELTFSARFVRRISCVNDDYFISLRYLCFDLDILFFGMVSIDAIWNWLPDSMRDPAISRDSFRHSLKTFLFSAYLCTWRIRAFWTMHSTNLLTYLLTNWSRTISLDNTREMIFSQNNYIQIFEYFEYMWAYRTLLSFFTLNSSKTDNVIASRRPRNNRSGVDRYVRAPKPFLCFLQNGVTVQSGLLSPMHTERSPTLATSIHCQHTDK